MNSETALRNLVEAQGEVIEALSEAVDLQRQRMDKLASWIESIGLLGDARSEVVNALQVDYDEKLSMIVARLNSISSFQFDKTSEQ